MNQQPHFVLFGIPVRIGGGALILSGLAVFLLQGLGAALAAAFIASVLVHELGHAFAFRRYGATSAISIHGLGGMTISYDAHRLSHREHVIVSAAGPLIQLLLLGLPALAISFLTPVTGIAASILSIMVFINIGWAVVNLLPLYPLDGGQILFHSLSHRKSPNAWGMTRTIAIVLGIPLAFAAFQFGYPIGALLIGFTIFQGISSPPASAAMGQNNPIRDAAARAQSQQMLITGGGDGMGLALRDLASGSRRRFEIFVASLEANGDRPEDLAGLRAWAGLLDGQADATQSNAVHPNSAVFDLTRSILGAQPTNTIALRQALVDPAAKDEALVAVAALHRSGSLSAVLTGAAPEALGGLADRTAVAGMLDEQQAIRRIIQLAANG